MSKDLAAKREIATLDDATLRRSLDAWERAVVESRVEAHIDAADCIRNEYLAETVRRRRAAEAMPVSPASEIEAKIAALEVAAAERSTMKKR